MMEAVRTSKTSVDNHFIRQYIPEDNSKHQDCILLKRILRNWADPDDGGSTHIWNVEAVRTSETSVDNHFTRQYIP
jgi:hypothetical protein